MTPLGPMLRGRWQALPVRDRRALVLALIGAAIAAEALWVWPMRQRRLAVAAAAQAEHDGQLQARADRESQAQATRQALRAELARLDRELQRLGRDGGPREPLSSLMQRSASGHGLTLLSLRALPAEPVQAAAVAASGAAASATDAAEAPADAASAPPPAWRHRIELQVAGPALPLLQRLDALVQLMAPLRVERVRVAAGTAGEATATLTLFTIGPERTWLEL